jgi:hypothetical protein
MISSVYAHVLLPYCVIENVTQVSNDVNYANQSLYGEMRPTFPLIA